MEKGTDKEKKDDNDLDDTQSQIPNVEQENLEETSEDKKNKKDYNFSLQGIDLKVKKGELVFVIG